MPTSRNHSNRPIPASLAVAFGPAHDLVLNDERPDPSFNSQISNKSKVDYICAAINMEPYAFSLDVPLPIEDWITSDDYSRVLTGFYLSDLRVQFYGQVLQDDPGERFGPVWEEHSAAQYWSYQFNKVVTRRNSGSLIRDARVLH